MRLVVFILSALLGIGFQQVSATSLVSLSPSNVQTGEEFTFVAETKNTSVFKLWIVDSETGKKTSLCRNTEVGHFPIHQCNVTAPNKSGSYDLLVKLKSSAGTPYIIDSTKKLIVGNDKEVNFNVSLMQIQEIEDLNNLTGESSEFEKNSTILTGDNYSNNSIELQNESVTDTQKFNDATASDNSLKDIIVDVYQDNGKQLLEAKNKAIGMNDIHQEEEGKHYDVNNDLENEHPDNENYSDSENFDKEHTNNYIPGTCIYDIPEGYEAYFCDEFAYIDDNALPSEELWDFQPKQINNELQCYTDKASNDKNSNQQYRNVKIENRNVDVGMPGSSRTESGNYLVLTLHKKAISKCPGDGKKYDYTSGAIATRIRGNGEYLVGKKLHNNGQQGLPFGRYEIRAKIPKGRGTWPAIWMLGHKSGPGGVGTLLGWPDAGEIDIMEAVGYEESRGYYLTHHTLHRTRACSGSNSGANFMSKREPVCFPNDPRTRHNGSSIQWPEKAIIDGPARIGSPHYLKPRTFWSMKYEHPEPPSANFHVYTLIWGKDSIEILVDGDSRMKASVNDNGLGKLVEVGVTGGFKRNKVTVTQDGVSKLYDMQGMTDLGWPFSKELGNEFHLILNLAFGGGWGGADGVDDTIFANGPVEMLIDYVRVYTPIASN